MKTITVPSKDQVSADAQAIFEQIEKKMGKVPNLYATIGYSAAALKGFLDFEESLSHSAFTPKEKEAINLVVSQVNNCDYCLAAHTMLAGLKGFTKDETLFLRRGISSDTKLTATLQLAKSIAGNKGNAGQALISEFFNAGYNEAALIELAALITVRTFTNYVYTLTQIPVDFPAAEKLN